MVGSSEIIHVHMHFQGLLTIITCQVKKSYHLCGEFVWMDLRNKCVNRQLKATQGRVVIGSMQRQSEFCFYLCGKYGVVFQRGDVVRGIVITDEVSLCVTNLLHQSPKITLYMGKH